MDASSPHFDIAVAGEINLDLVLDGIPYPMPLERELLASSFRVTLGSSAAILNTGGNGGGILAPMITPVVGEALGWGAAVAVGAFICLGGMLLWLWIVPPAESKMT